MAGRSECEFCANQGRTRHGHFTRVLGGEDAKVSFQCRAPDDADEEPTPFSFFSVYAEKHAMMDGLDGASKFGRMAALGNGCDLPASPQAKFRSLKPSYT